ncbi:MAG: hypothetical protein ABSE68_00865, partial [Minisyncoccia bacterium]
MRDLFKKIILSLFSLALILNFNAPVFPIPAAKADTDCSEWSALFTVNNSSTGAVLNALNPVVIPNQVTSASPFWLGSSTPPTVSLPSDTAWKCSQGFDTIANSGVLTSEDKKQSQGTESCQKAVALSARFGGYTALNGDFSSKIQKGVLDNVTNFLKKDVLSNTGIDLNFNNMGGLFVQAGVKAGEFIQSQFNSLIGNPLKDAISTESQKIIDSAKQQIASTLNIPIKSGITSIVGLSQTVPVNDDTAAGKLDKVNDSVNNVIAEQKRQAIIQDTRDKCNNLLKSTTATIKKALLYQLSTQITDWVMTGKDPQFIKNPGTFFEQTGRLALDRFISNVAPQLCQPFRLDVQIQIPAVTHETNPFYEQVRCTLNQVTSNINNFYKDFRQGGWLT